MNEITPYLPTLNACLNSLAVILLIGGYRSIKAKNVERHKRFMLGAFTMSALFLLSYVIYHVQAGSVPFKGKGFIRVVYFSILIPHVILAAIQLPLILWTLYLALKEKFDRHRKIAKITYPVWLFVSVTGVLVYLMLYHLPQN